MTNFVNILQCILQVLPVAEQVAITFIHNADSTHKFHVVTGTVNEVAPVAVGIAQAIAQANQSAKSALQPAA